MNREILLRGKRTDNEEWIYGFYCKMDETTYAFVEDYEKNPVPTHHYILLERMTDWGMPNQIYKVEVDPETVCQYTGLTDKNGRKIFEGDVVKHFNYPTIPSKFDVGIISWDEKYCKFCRNSMSDNRFYLIDNDCEYEVIGNIFDNPEIVREITEGSNPNDKIRDNEAFISCHQNAHKSK